MFAGVVIQFLTILSSETSGLLPKDFTRQKYSLSHWNSIEMYNKFPKFQMQWFGAHQHTLEILPLHTGDLIKECHTVQTCLAVLKDQRKVKNPVFIYVSAQGDTR